jgi:large subunit ribosomal protein L17
MRHQVHGKKLNRSRGHRKALYRNLTQSLVEHERITTTLPKAKAVRPVVEKLITRAKQQDLAARRAVLAYVPSPEVADKLYSVLGVRFADRPGGYTRIIKTGRRAGDGAEMAILELVELSAPAVVAKKPKKAEAKPEAKKPAAAKRPAAKKAAGTKAKTEDKK